MALSPATCLPQLLHFSIPRKLDTFVLFKACRPSICPEGPNELEEPYVASDLRLHELKKAKRHRQE